MITAGFAEEVVRDYVQGNFADKGMYADWAIHDSENDKGQHNRQQSKAKLSGRRKKFNEKAIEM